MACLLRDPNAVGRRVTPSLRLALGLSLAVLAGCGSGGGTVGTAYAANFFLSGGVAPHTWSLVSGQLPPGLSLVPTDAPTDNNNQLAGTPTTAGTFAFTMKVTDSLGNTATGQTSVTIDPRPPLQINSPISCCNPGLTLSSGNPGTFINNVLSGTPTKAGTFAFTMKVTDNLGGTATQAFNININP